MSRLPYRVLLEKCRWIQWTAPQICCCLFIRSCASCSKDTVVFPKLVRLKSHVRSLTPKVGFKTVAVVVIGGRGTWRKSERHFFQAAQTWMNIRSTKGMSQDLRCNNYPMPLNFGCRASVRRGKRADKLRHTHTRSAAYSVELVLPNKPQIWGGPAKLHWYHHHIAGGG